MPLDQGGVYASYTWKTKTAKTGPYGYFGSQLKPAGFGSSLLIFSVWDGDRWSGTGKDKTVKVSNALAWPLDSQCKRNCQDCALASLAELREKGLTSGTKCLIEFPTVPGDTLSFTLERVQVEKTINTADFDGMPPVHGKELGEFDRDVTGSKWLLTVKSSSGSTAAIPLLFENDGAGITDLHMFDEMLGCNKCNDNYHKDERVGPFVEDQDGSSRMPSSAKAWIVPDSSCNRYAITGNKDGNRFTFEAGPRAPLSNVPTTGGQASAVVVW